MYNRLNSEVKFVCVEGRKKTPILFCLIRKEQGQLSNVIRVTKFFKITFSYWEESKCSLRHLRNFILKHFILIVLFWCFTRVKKIMRISFLYKINSGCYVSWPYKIVCQMKNFNYFFSLLISVFLIAIKFALSILNKNRRSNLINP